MKPLLLACLLACLVPLTGLAQAPAANPDTRTVEAVVEAFRSSIIDKDKERFLKLFLDGNTAWQSVTGDANLRKLREKHPTAAKVRIDPGNSPRSFIDDIVASQARQEEKFDNLKIETDGDIASVWFDYSYHDGDTQTNQGKEAWHLLRTDDGWKIVSVIWSMNWTP